MVVRANNAAAAGSVGTVETQALDLSGPLALDCGRDLYPVRIAYETYGTHTVDPDWQGGHYYGTGRALRHQADNFVKRFDANTYLYTSARIQRRQTPIIRRFTPLGK